MFDPSGSAGSRVAFQIEPERSPGTQQSIAVSALQSIAELLQGSESDELEGL